MKVCPHSSHMYGFCALCRCTCRRRLPAKENRRPQVSHSYGRSPVCVRSCSISRSFFAKLRLHVSQTYDCAADAALGLSFSPEGFSKLDTPPDSVGRRFSSSSWCVSNLFWVVTVRERRRRSCLLLHCLRLPLRLTLTLELRLAFFASSEFWQWVLTSPLFKLLSCVSVAGSGDNSLQTKELSTQPFSTATTATATLAFQALCYLR